MGGGALTLAGAGALLVQHQTPLLLLPAPSSWQGAAGWSHLTAVMGGEGGAASAGGGRVEPPDCSDKGGGGCSIGGFSFSVNLAC